MGYVLCTVCCTVLGGRDLVQWGKEKCTYNFGSKKWKKRSLAVIDRIILKLNLGGNDTLTAVEWDSLSICRSRVVVETTRLLTAETLSDSRLASPDETELPLTVKVCDTVMPGECYGMEQRLTVAEINNLTENLALVRFETPRITLNFPGIAAWI